MSEQTSIERAPVVTSLAELTSQVVDARARLISAALPATPPAHAQALAVLELALGLSAVAREAWSTPQGVVIGYRGMRRALRTQVTKDMPGGTFHEVYQPAEAGKDGLISAGDIAYVCTLTLDNELIAWKKNLYKDTRDLMEIMPEGIEAQQRWDNAYKAALNSNPKPEYKGFGIVFKSESFAKPGKPEMMDRYARAKSRAFKAAFRNIGIDIAGLLVHARDVGLVENTEVLLDVTEDEPAPAFAPNADLIPDIESAPYEELPEMPHWLSEAILKGLGVELNGSAATANMAQDFWATVMSMSHEVVPEMIEMADEGLGDLTPIVFWIKDYSRALKDTPRDWDIHDRRRKAVAAADEAFTNPHSSDEEE